MWRSDGARRALGGLLVGALRCGSSHAKERASDLWTAALSTATAAPLHGAAGADVGQPTPESHPEVALLRPGEILPGVTAAELRARREALMADLPQGSVLIVEAAPIRKMAGVIPYPYRQDPDYLYLTGCLQPGGVAVIAYDGSTTMYMPTTTSEAQLWTGPVADVRAAADFFRADYAVAVEAFLQDFAKLSKSADIIWCDRLAVSGMVAKALEEMRELNKETRSPRALLHSHRWVKSPAEIALMRSSAGMVSQAFLHAMRFSCKHPEEQSIAAAVEFSCRRQGAQRMAFPAVAARGPNACIVHYSRNDNKVRQGDLLLLDAGCEYFGYTSDVTRTWPPLSPFSAAQREVYEIVLETLKECTRLCCPGTTLLAIHKHAVRLLSKGIAELGLLPDSPNSISRGPYRQFFPTSIGHWLGMDTHDCPTVGVARSLVPGVILTLEPGIYIPLTADVPDRYRGIGIRIEDDVLVTESGCEVLTASVPKEVNQLEAFLRTSEELVDVLR